MLSCSSNVKYLHDGSASNILIKKNKYLTKKSKIENDTRDLNQEKKARITEITDECSKKITEETKRDAITSKDRKIFLTEYEDKILDFSFSKLIF